MLALANAHNAGSTPAARSRTKPQRASSNGKTVGATSSTLQAQRESARPPAYCGSIAPLMHLVAGSRVSARPHYLSVTHPHG